jgi:Mg-chelatase subunit ChlD
MSKAIKKLVEGDDVLLSEETTIYLIDNSSSMHYILGNYESQQISKLDAVKMAVKAMLEARLGYASADKVGIIAFTSRAENYTNTLMEPKVAEPDHMKVVEQLCAAGGTPMYQGFEAAARQLADAQGLVRIVLLSDGEPNEGYRKSDVRGLVQKLSKEYGFIVDTVGIGLPGQTTEYDEAFMKQLAADGMGEFYPIDDANELKKLLVQFTKERKQLLGTGVKLLGSASSF